MKLSLLAETGNSYFLLPLFLVTLFMFGGTAVHSQTLEARIPLTLQHVAPALPPARLIGRTNSDKPLSLSIVLPLRNRAELDTQLRHISDPQDPLYGHYLTPTEFAHEFGPDQSDVNAVIAFAETHGFIVKDISAGGTLVHVVGTASSVGDTFGVRLNDYISTDGRTFYAADREPTVPIALSTRILSVLGLSNAQKAQPLAHSVPATVQLNAYTGHAGLAPPDIKSIYNLTSIPYSGKGQVAGLYEDSTFTRNDISVYFSNYNISIPVNPVSVDGYNTGSAPNGDSPEVVLDIDMLAALAPGLFQIRVYEATQDVGFTQSLVDALTAIASEPSANRPNVISVSYALSETQEAPADFEALDQVTAQLAIQGQTVCIASGDAGAYTDQSTGTSPNVSFPADDPYVLCVGGTDLNDKYSASHTCVYVSETSWADPGDKGRGPIGTGGGGGYSNYFPFPSWQAGAFTASGNPQGSMTGRNMPDVSLYGDYDDGGYDIYLTNPGTLRASWAAYNGTSAASPLWAAFLADVNQGRVSKGYSTIGFSNPSIYRAAENFPSAFLDISDGSNNLFYTAVRGYDNSTGWGSFQGANLLNVLAPNPVPVITQFSPTAGWPGTVLTLTGSGFTGATNMSIGGVAAAFTVNSDTQVTATVPAGATTGPIIILGPYGRSVPGANFVINPGPTITQFSPTAGWPGTVVALTGSGFTGATNMSIGGVAAAFTVNSDTKVTATVPAGATTGPIIILGPHGRSAPGANFTIYEPVIYYFAPTAGWPGMVVTLTGIGFSGATNMSIGGVAASFTVNSDTKVTATVPVGATTGPIIILGPNGRSAPGVNFTVNPGPTITQFSPTGGWPGTVVTVTGSGFTGATNMSIGGVAATFTVNSDTKVTATVPAGATTGPVIILGPHGRSTPGTNFVIYEPVVYYFTPTSGWPGTVVTLTGIGFTGATNMSIGGVAASLTVNSDTKVTATVPAGATTGPIIILGPNGRSVPGVNFVVH